MLRGFTLLEMLITISVMSVLLAFAAPNLYLYQQKHKIMNLASELHGFLVQAKSEAVFRNADLWAHIEMDSNPTVTGKWSIRVTDSETLGAGETIQVMTGDRYRNIFFQSNYLSNQIKFNGIRGKVNNGTLRFALTNVIDKPLNLRSSFGASRIIICAEGGEFYGFSQCSSQI